MKRQQGIVSAINELSGARDLQNIMDVVRLAARDLTGADGVTFVLQDNGNCFYAEESAISPLWKGKRFPMDICISGWVMINKREVVIPDITVDSRIPQDAYRPTFVKSLVMVPVCRQEPVAAIGAYWARIHKASEEEILLLYQLADAASVAMTNVHLYNELNSKAEEYRNLLDVANNEIRLRKMLEGRYEGIYEHAATGIAITDWAGYYLNCNPAYCEITGYNETELQEIAVLALMHPDDHYRCFREIERLKSGGLKSFDMQNKYLKKDGSQIWVRRYVSILPEVKGEPALLLELITDITEIVAAQKELERGRKHLELALRGANLGTWEIEIPTGNSVFSDRWEEMLGYKPGELSPNFSTILDLLHPDDLERVKREYMHSFESDEIFSAEYRLRGKNGEYRWILGQGKILDYNKDGTPLRMFGTNLDLTNQHNLESRIRQMEKMDAIGQLAGGVAHDFNNQLTGIMGYTDLLLLNITDPTLRGYANDVLNAAKRGADLTRQLLTFSRKGQYQSKAVDIHKIINEVISILTHTIDKKIEVKSFLNAASPIVTGDPSLLQNAFLNLAINARDAMSEGGTLTFDTQIEELNEDYCQSVPYDLSPGLFAKICISDTGSGIDPAHIKRIFEPFFTTKAVGKGTGMGLAAVYGTVKHHHGAINVYSELGYGTTFRIYLPLSENTCDTNKYHNDDGTHNIAGTRVMIVEDEERIRKLIVAMLESEKCLTYTAENGLEAVDMYSRYWKDIDIVIFDMIMPKLDGKEAFLKMKEINPDIKAILASGYSVNSTASDLLELGVKLFIQKPFTKSQLIEAIAKIQPA